MKKEKKKKIYQAFIYLTSIISLLRLKTINYQSISLYFLIFLLIYFLYKTKDAKVDKTTKIFSILFGSMITIGNPDNIAIRYIPFVIASIIGWYYIFSRLFYLLDNSLSKINVLNKKNDKKISRNKFIIISMIIGLICYLPYFLRFFPGPTSYDAYQQLLQVIGFTGYSNHHPLLHTLIIKLFYSIGTAITQKQIMGVAFYVIFQMITVAFAYSYLIYTLYKNNINKILVIITWAFFFLYPINAIYSITIWKDILFSSAVVLFSTFLWNHYHEKRFLENSSTDCRNSADRTGYRPDNNELHFASLDNR